MGRGGGQNEEWTMCLIRTAAVSIAVWRSRTHSGSSLIGMSGSVCKSALGGEILFLC